MAEPNDNAPMSVIPYDSHREVVLRHNDAVVVFDTSSRQLVLRNPTDNVDLDPSLCPYCRRPLHDEPDRRESSGRTSSPGVQSGFVNPEYFRMLHQSLQGSAESSTPPSPRRRLVQPVQPASRRATPTPPPAGAEFIGSNPAAPDDSHGISSSAFSQNFLQKVFLIERELGRGGRGVVLLVKHVLDGVDCGHFACKRIPIGDDHKWLEKVLVEVQLLQSLHHQNLVSYHHVWLEDTKVSNFGPRVPCAFILQQYCNGGDLQSHIVGNAQVTTTTEQLKERIRRRSKGELDPPMLSHGMRTLHFDEIYSFFRDMSAGIQFLHSKGFIHRDLKPSNCLLHDTGQELRVLVSDFGEVQEQNAVRRSTGATGTLSYCAPEVLQRVTPNGPYGNFTFKSDIFSLGMILYFMCFASLPYRSANVLHEENEDAESLRAEVCQWTGFDAERKQRPDLPEKLYVFLQRLLAVRPEDRPTADEVYNGIRTGAGLGEPNSQVTPRTSPQPLEELTPGRRRIISVDSPMSSSPTRSPGPPSKNIAQSTAISKARPTRLRHQFLQENSLRYASAQDEDTRSPDRELILRHAGPSSPQRTMSPRENDMDGRDIFHSPYLLTAGSPFRANWVQRMIILLNTRRVRFIISIAFITLKLLILLQPCASRGINPLTVYPLLLLALWDFALGGTNYAFSVAAAVIHCVVFAMSWQSGTLCATKPTNEWFDEQG